MMLLYLALAYNEMKKAPPPPEGGILQRTDPTEQRAMESPSYGAVEEAKLAEAIHHGAVKRIRPKIMTATAIIAGLLPILWSTGTGADMMKRIAAPMVGGVVTSVLLELLVYPVIYYLWKSREMKKQIMLANFNKQS